MEAKKNPGKDVHKMTGMFFQIGLGVSIAIVITAFEWTTEIKKPKLRTTDELIFELYAIPVTKPEPQLPTPFKNEVKPKLLKNFAPEIVETYSEDKDPFEQPIIDIDQVPDITPFIIENDNKEKVEPFWTFVEDPATPVGGYSSFYKFMRDNMKYPKLAKSNNVSGKVLVEFIVNKDGSVANSKVLRGIGSGCDEEAVRVITLSKWNPGKQRGNPVRVKMVVPIVFQLH